MKDSSNLKQLLEDAWSQRREGKYEEAGNLVREAQRLCSENDYNAQGRIFHIYMQFESDHKNYSKAVELCKQSLSYYKKANNLNRIAHSTRHIADLQFQLGEDAVSEQNYRTSINIYKSNPDTHIGDLANAYRGFGLLLEKLGKIEEAIIIWTKTKEYYSACRLKEGVEEADQKLNFLK